MNRRACSLLVIVMALVALLLWALPTPDPAPAALGDRREQALAHSLPEARPARDVTPREETPAAPAGSRIFVRGSLTVVPPSILSFIEEVLGEDLPEGIAAERPERFSFDLVCGDGPQASLPVAGQHGRFKVWLPHAGEYYISNVKGDGFEFGDAGTYTLADGDSISIEIEAGRRATLVVTDALTGAPVPGAVAVPCRWGRFWSPRAKDLPDKEWRSPDGTTVRCIPPAQASPADQVLMAGEDGRIALRQRTGWSAWLVRAPGYAWTADRVDHNVGGENRVPLPPGGGLRVHARGLGDLKVAQVCLVGMPCTWSRPAPLGRLKAGESLHVEGLLPGPHAVDLRGDQGQILASGQVDVIAGETVEFTLRPETNLVVAEGRITIPKEWGAWPTHLGLRASGKYLPVTLFDLQQPTGGRTASFRTTHITAGRYCVSTLAWKAEVEIREGRDLDIKLPVPAEVLLEVVDAQTEKAVPKLRLEWTSSATDRALPFRCVTEVLRDDDSPIRILAVPGEIAITVHAAGYLSEKIARAPTSAGTCILPTVRLERSATLRVSFELYGEPYSAHVLRFEVVPKGLRHGLAASCVDGEELIVGLRAGVYQVVVDVLPNLQIEDPGEVLLRAGETTHVTIRVTEE
jgi:hypothetical protein